MLSLKPHLLEHETTVRRKEWLSSQQKLFVVPVAGHLRITAGLRNQKTKRKIPNMYICIAYIHIFINCLVSSVSAMGLGY